MDDSVVNWNSLPGELMSVIAHKLSSWEDYMKLSTISKSFMSALSEDEKPLLPPQFPLLFLAEQVAEGAVFSCELEKEEGDEEEYEEEEEYGEEEEDTKDEESEEEEDEYDYRYNSVGNTRGLYSLSTGKKYYFELPEAAGKLILGTNKGWLLTLGRDLLINLLHPLSRQQIPLPPMHAFPIQYKHCSPEEVTYRFVQKVSMSSKVLSKNTPVVDKETPDPIVMTIYGECRYLGFARLGDKVWTHVNIQSLSFEDIAYYNGKFYAVNCEGEVFVCDIDDKYIRGGQTRGTKIATCPLKPNYNFDRRYLFESGSGLWLVVRICKVKYIKQPHPVGVKYRTTRFFAWKLELKYADDGLETPSCTCIEENCLGEEPFFIGRASSVSLQSSEYIKPNSIYFTDDNSELYNRRGGGHDMGIYDMATGTIEPYFQGKSLHPISPPLWYL